MWCKENSSTDCKITIFFTLFLKISYCSLIESCYSDDEDYCFSQDDILTSDFLPGSLLFESYGGIQDDSSHDHKTLTKNVTADGTYLEALNEMDYHRTRMNDYLCHGFIADRIFHDMRSIRTKRGQDVASMNSMPDFIGTYNVTAHDKMLSDEGSTKYKEWLHRTTTLDDVYRRYAPRKILKNRISLQIPQNVEEFDGEVTGFAMPAPSLPDKTGYYDYPQDDLVSSPTGQHFIHHHVGAGSAHYPSHDEPIPVVHEDHYYHVPTNHDEDVHWSIESDHKGRGELTIKDFFEIALTALAFLAFGLFVIQLLMAITNASTATVITDGVRFRRDIASSPYNSNFELNELSHRVLQSIEAAMIVDPSSNDCLKWSLCRDNRHSKNTNTAQRIWIPIWSLGMSWVSSRMSRQPMWSAVTASIKASIFGLGGANCDVVYPNCNLIRERKRRHRRQNK